MQGSEVVIFDYLSYLSLYVHHAHYLLGSRAFCANSTTPSIECDPFSDEAIISSYLWLVIILHPHKQISEEFNVAVLLTNQVMSDPGGEHIFSLSSSI
jgi:hypothetical protein